MYHIVLNIKESSNYYNYYFIVDMTNNIANSKWSPSIIEAIERFKKNIIDTNHSYCVSECGENINPSNYKCIGVFETLEEIPSNATADSLKPLFPELYI